MQDDLCLDIQFIIAMNGFGKGGLFVHIVFLVHSLYAL